MKSVTTPNTWLRLRAYLSGAVLYGAAIAIYSFLPYYRGFISRTDLDVSYLPAGLRHGLELALAASGASTYELILHLYFSYLVIGLLWFLLSPRARENTRTVIFWRVVGRIIKGWLELFVSQGTAGPPATQLSKEEKTTILFFLVKFFFVPIMVNFFFANLGAFLTSAHTLLAAAPAEDLDGQRLLFF